MSDEDQIKETIQTYFDCMYESSAAKTHAIRGSVTGCRG